jgi:hypothetical protein
VGVMETTALRAKVSRTQALSAFQRGWLAATARMLAAGPLRSVAEAFVPFRLFRVCGPDENRMQEKLLAIDAVEGSLDLYGFDAAPAESELVAVASRNILPALVSVTRCAELLEDRVRRMVYQRGFFRARGVRNVVEFTGMEFCVPYWLGFCGRGGKASVLVMDAVRARMEGGKARELFRKWLVSGEGWVAEEQEISNFRFEI